MQLDFLYAEYDLIKFEVSYYVNKRGYTKYDVLREKRDKEFDHKTWDEDTHWLVNSYYNYCLKDYIIEFVEGEKYDSPDTKKKYFVITETNTITDPKSGTVSKRITAKALECELTQRYLHNYKSQVNDTITTKTIREIFNDINQDKLNGTWKLGHVDPDVERRYVTYDATDTSVWNFFQSLQESLRCVFRFEIIYHRKESYLEKVMNVYDATVYRTCPVCGSRDIVYNESWLMCAGLNCGELWQKNAIMKAILQKTNDDGTTSGKQPLSSYNRLGIL